MCEGVCVRVCVCVCVGGGGGGGGGGGSKCVYNQAHRYALNQTVIFSDTALTEASWGNVVPTMALKSVFTTKAAMCSGVPRGF